MAKSDFFTDMIAWTEEANKEVARETAKVVRTIFKSIVEFSPYDTGRFIQNWQISDQVYNMSVIGVATKEQKKSEIDSKVTDDYFLSHDKIYMYNSVLYAFRVEYNGWIAPNPKHPEYAPIGRTLGMIAGGV